MMAEEKWFGRSFDATLPVGRFPAIIERLRGTPARLEERTRSLDADQLTRRSDGQWSVQEHVGHLVDLEALWRRRADQLFAGETTLAAADLTNQPTFDAQHNRRRMADLLGQFSIVRAHFLERLLSADKAVLSRTATHPRLGTPMRLIDLAFFVAEHDDRHLAAITRVRQEQVRS
jgi:uncharacterized damage-inducible protein DinB